MSNFQVGFCKKDITPPLGTLLAGYPRDRISNNVLDNLYASAIAMKQEDTTALLISVDICGLSVEICDTMRADIAGALDIKKEDIIVFAVHTHSGPITSTTPGWGFADDSFLTDILFPQALEAAKGAFADLKPAVMAVGTTDSHAGMNRRQIKDGKVILGQNPDGPYDPTMTVVRFQTPEGAPIGTFVHYGAHPTSAGSNWSITRDWPGLVVDRIEEISGAGCLYMNGAEGDVGPRLSCGETTGDESSIIEVGSIAREDAQRAYEAATEFFVPEMKVFSGNVFLPFVTPPTLQETTAMIEAMGDPDKLVDVQIMKHAQLQRIKKMWESGEEFPAGQDLQQTMIALGDFAIVPGPFETFSEIALAIKAGSPYSKTIYLGLANGSLGYLPTVEQLPYGGYEVDSFHAVGITGFVDEASVLFANGNIDLLKQMKES